MALSMLTVVSQRLVDLEQLPISSRTGSWALGGHADEARFFAEHQIRAQQSALLQPRDQRLPRPVQRQAEGLSFCTTVSPY